MVGIKGLWITIGLAVVATIIVFAQTVHFSFVNYDDPDILQKNEEVLNFDIKRMFTKESAYDYVPVTLLTFALENEIFGQDPFWYHFNNLVLHVLNIVLVALLLFRLFPNYPMILTVSVFLFAVHPLQVESVAWITQRKNVLYTLFYVLALLCYLDGKRVTSGVLFVVSCLAKATAITLPVVLLLIDFLKKKRLTRSDVIRKAPFFAVSIAVAVIHMNMHGTDVHMKKDFGVSTIFGNFVNSLSFYISKIFFPVDLVGYYKTSIYSIPLENHVITLILIAGFLWFLYRRTDLRILLLFGLGWFLITLGPTLQLIPFGNYFLYADRYVYFPIIGVGLVVGTLMDSIKDGASKQLANVFLVAVVGLMISLSFSRTQVWKNSLTLWEDQIAKYPNTDLAYFNLGGAYLFDYQDAARAIPYYQRALQIDPTYVEAVFNWGLALNSLNQEAAALEKFKQVIQMVPTVGKAYINIGVLLDRAGKLEEAGEYLEKGANLEVKNQKAWEILAKNYEKRGISDKAESALDRARSIATDK